MGRADGSKSRVRRGASAQPQAPSEQVLTSHVFHVLTERGPLARGGLLQRFSHAYNVPGWRVLAALQRDARIVVGSDAIRLAAATPALAPPADPGDAPDSELSYMLSLPETDEVLFTVQSQVRMRCDFIQTSSVQIWITAKVDDPASRTALVALGDAQQPGPGLTLPLRNAVGEPPELPCLLVWQAATPAHAARTVTRITAAWPTAGTWRMESRSCTPAELERRIEGARTIRRVAARGERRTSVSTCAHCGLPLSDPESVALGIGPECRRRYQPEVLRAARNRRPANLPGLGAKSPKQWVKALRPWLLGTPAG